MNKRVVLISSGQPSLNPRLIKEADALQDAGYNVIVIYQFWNMWATVFDEKLFLEKKWTAIRVGGSPIIGRFIYHLTRIVFKFSKILNNLGITYFDDFAITRSSFLLTRAAKKNTADLYIAHNLGALPAAFKASRKNRSKFGFDAEDFHRLETNVEEHSSTFLLKKHIEDKYIPFSDYLTTSSPQISALYQGLYPTIAPFTILNVCSEVTVNKTIAKRPVKIFWFSQTIGPNRGLEVLFDALSMISSSDYEIHLLGNPNPMFLSNLNENVKPIIYSPIASTEIITFASRFDIGIAGEPAFSFNNDNALSNKIFSYLSAGLAIIASDTTAQADFINMYPNVGTLYSKNSIQDLYGVISNYIYDVDKLEGTKLASFNLSQTHLNWETEREKFISIVNKTLGI